MIGRYALSRLAILAVATFMVPTSASADLIVTLQPTARILTVGESSFLDVFVTGTSTTGDAVSGYSLALEEVSGLSYTGATTATAATNGYIFPSTGSGLTVVSTSPDLSYFDLTSGGPTNVSSAETYGAGRISFTAIVPGNYTVQFDQTPGRSAFTDSGGGAFSATFTGASITIAAVPEPTTTLLLGLLAVVACGVVWRRRACAAPIAARG